VITEPSRLRAAKAPLLRRSKAVLLGRMGGIGKPTVAPAALSSSTMKTATSSLLATA
jgi:hypothetical protein